MRSLLVVALAASVLAVSEQQILHHSSAALDALNAFAIYDQSGFGSWDLSERRLVQFEGKEPVWITEAEKLQAKIAGQRFFDVTEVGLLENNAHAVSLMRKAFPKLSRQKLVNSVLANLSIDGPVENLQHFTSYRTRHYRSDTGRQSQLWLLSKIQEVTKEFASDELSDLINISEFKHAWGQNSIIARINGSESEDIVVVSAHQDSTNMVPFLPAPGADDDGSGTVTILEAYRGLLAADFKPVKTLEFHWYSAEEGGLLGSQAVVQEYQARAAPVYAQIQFDMTAFVKNGTREEVGIITTETDPELTEFLRTLVGEYIDIPWADTQCGYGCSDHASWNKAGYRASNTYEGRSGNKHIHSADDRIDISPEFSFEHLLHFSKIAAAFAIELAGSK